MGLSRSRSDQGDRLHPHDPRSAGVGANPVDAANDLLDLLRDAVRNGFSRTRAKVIGSRAGNLPAKRVRKIERATRAWLRRRDL